MRIVILSDEDVRTLFTCVEHTVRSILDHATDEDLLSPIGQQALAAMRSAVSALIEVGQSPHED